MLKKLQEIQKMELQSGVFSVYDMDGRTTQEIFNQFFCKINDIIDITNASLSLIEYLTNGGLKEETAKQLVEWMQDGTLKEIVDEQVLSEISEKVDNAVKVVQEQKEEIEKITFELKDNFEFLKDTTSNNVKYYGAKGDGVTDDTDAFKKALFGLSYTEDKTIFIPSGIYLINDSLEIPKDATLLGESNSIIKFNNNYISLIFNGSNITIKDLILEGNADNIVTTNVLMDNGTNTVQNIEIDNVVFRNFKGTLLTCIDLIKAKNVHIKNCLFDNLKASELICINAGVYTTYLFVKDNIFKNLLKQTIDSKVYAIYMNNNNKVSDSIIDGNHFNASYASEYIYLNVQNVTITNNTFIKALETICILINDTKNTKIKNNYHDVLSNSITFQPVIKIKKGTHIFLNGENIFADGAPASSKANKPFYVFENASVIIDNVICSGKYYTTNLIDIQDTQLTMKNCNIESDGAIDNILKIKKGCKALRVENNNVDLNYGSSFIKKEDEVEAGKARIINNSFEYTMNAISSNKTSILLKGFIRQIDIENNKLNGNVSVYNISAMTLQNNTLGSLYVNSDKYDILSQNNVFGLNMSATYYLSCHSSQGCNFISKNNYNKNNLSLIYFYSDKGSFINANNINVMTIDDINAPAIQDKQNLYIARDNNITVDVYTRCFVKTSQSQPRFTYYSSDEPLLNYKKPHNTLIYNAGSGKSHMYVEHKGINKTTTL